MDNHSGDAKTKALKKKSGWESWKGLAKRNRENRKEQRIKAGTYRKHGGAGKDTRSNFMKELDEHKHLSATKYR